MSSSPTRPRPWAGSAAQETQEELSSLISSSSQMTISFSADDGGASGGQNGPKRRSCQGPCIYLDTDEPGAPTPVEDLQEQITRMGAELESLRNEFALIRQAEARTTPATTTEQPLPLAPGVAPPPHANRLVIPGMTIGTNHLHRIQVPFRPRIDTNNLVSYASPVSVFPYDYDAAALLGDRNSDRANAAAGPVGAPPPMYPLMPSYYVPPRGNHLSHPYAVHPMPAPNVAYGQLPPNRKYEASLDALDPPGEVVDTTLSNRHSAATRPALSCPISNERRSASGSTNALSPHMPSTSAMPLIGSLPPAVTTPVATAISAPPAVIRQDHASSRPIPGYFAHSTANIDPTTAFAALYEQQRQLPATPQYRVLLGQQPSPAAVADWQAMIEDSTTRSSQATPTRTTVGQQDYFGSDAAGTSSGAESGGLSSMMAPDAAGGGGSQP
ncbi:hypothetical protein JCM10908_002608 [Rhodotorula pacifica]|uniref:uncharacterized protein n=1 Tax=Rhodotorula pacifica TaxID=1495444 RepID=UPI0031756B01